MEVIHTIDELRSRIAELKREVSFSGGTVGFVPTMGYLHRGHASLLEVARENNDIVVLSIFVNPTQFGPNEDFDKYPRNTERDLEIARESGTDLVFLPEVSEMYPQKSRTKVMISEVTDRLCGASRPGHFDGVGLVVTKLFNIVQPDQAYFGLKDAQQVAVIQQMVTDLNMNVEIVPCPTVREEDGLALSSRNVYLSDEERKQALVISQALSQAPAWLKETNSAVQVRERIITHINTSPLANIDYVELLAYPSLQPVDKIGSDTGPVLAAAAVKFGNTRLIDNILFNMKASNASLEG